MTQRNRRRAARLRSHRFAPAEIMELRVNLSAGVPTIATESVAPSSAAAPSMDRESFEESLPQSASTDNIPQDLYDLLLDEVDSPGSDTGILAATTATPDSQQDLTLNSPSWLMTLGTTTIRYVSFDVFAEKDIVVSGPIWPPVENASSYYVFGPALVPYIELVDEASLVQIVAVDAGLVHHAVPHRHFADPIPATALTAVSSSEVGSSDNLRESSTYQPEGNRGSTFKETAQVDSSGSLRQTRRLYQNLDHIDPSEIISQPDGLLSNRVRIPKPPTQIRNTDDAAENSDDTASRNTQLVDSPFPEGMLPIGFEVGLASSRRVSVMSRSENFIAQTSLICEDLRLVDKRDRQRVLISDASTPANSGSVSVYHAFIVQAVAALHIVWTRNSSGRRGVRKLFDPILKRLRRER